MSHPQLAAAPESAANHESPNRHLNGAGGDIDSQPLKYTQALPAVRSNGWRWFTDLSCSPRGFISGPTYGGSNDAPKCVVRVLRDEKRDVAELTLMVRLAVDLTVNLDREQLQRLAFALLDAANDIDQHPAAVLAAKSTDTGAA